MSTTTVEQKTIADVCDRHASARAFTEWRKVIAGDGCGEVLTLTLCAHCTHELDVELVEREFALTVDDRESLDPKNLIDRKARP